MSKLNPETGCLTGSLPLSPIQRWFFGENWGDINHFNQSVLLKSKAKLSFQSLRRLFGVIARYHDIFRVVYSYQNGEYGQEYTDKSRILIREIHTCSQTLEDLSFEIRETSSLFQQSLNIFDGPLCAVVLFRCFDQIDRVLVIAHHLIVDGVSWRILIDDLEYIYQKSITGSKTIQLPAKGFSYRQWCSNLLEYSKDERLLSETDFWNNQIGSVLILENGSSYQKGFKTIEKKLSKDLTENLIRPPFSNTKTYDILLTALVTTIGNFFNVTDDISIILEGHGREVIYNMEVPRTIGWFTSVFPVKFPNLHNLDIDTAVLITKKTLDNIPRKGIGFGILKYYTDKIRGIVPQIGFNYLGQLDVSLNEDRNFKYSKFSTGDEVSNNNSLINAIDINCFIKHKKFCAEFSYKQSLISESDMLEFSDSFVFSLQKIICKI